MLYNWSVKDDGPFENSSLFGQPNSHYTFVSGQTTDLANDDHKRIIEERFDEYFGISMQLEWEKFLGESFGVC